MSKRYIGVDLEGTEARVAILTALPGGRVDVAVHKQSYDSAEDAAKAIVEMLGGEISLTDRLLTAMPCRIGLFRRTRFPFREKRKIEAALPLELASRLPVNFDEHVFSMLPPLACEKDYEIDAVVVNRQEIDDLLLHFPDPQQNPRRIDIYPFALLPALAKNDGILIYCRRLEIVVALIYDHKIWDYRLFPGTNESSEEDALDFISNQVSQLENAIGKEGLPLWVMGAGVTKTLLVEMRKTGRNILPPAPDILGQDLDCEMLPAALLALAEMRSAKKDERMNFRKGAFAARGQLETLRTKLIIAAVMLLLLLTGSALTMHLGYLEKKDAENSYKEQLQQIFRETMPANSPVVDIPMQLEGYLKELQEQVQAFGVGGQGVLNVLQILSTSIDVETPIDLQEFSYSDNGVRIEAVTNSFDSVNQIAEAVGNNKVFSGVEIDNAKLSVDNSQVDFELKLTLGSGGGSE